jgi:hypothetical protein
VIHQSDNTGTPRDSLVVTIQVATLLAVVSLGVITLVLHTGNATSPPVARAPFPSFDKWLPQFATGSNSPTEFRVAFRPNGSSNWLVITNVFTNEASAREVVNTARKELERVWREQKMAHDYLVP